MNSGITEGLIDVTVTELEIIVEDNGPGFAEKDFPLLLSQREYHKF